MEQREHLPRAPRLLIRAPVSLRSSSRMPWRDGWTVNISQSGVLVALDTPVELRGDVEFVIALSKGALQGPGVPLLPDLHCRGQIVRYETSDGDWAIYDPGCRNGLVVRGQTQAAIALSVDRGATWHPAGELTGTLDLTDQAKGHRQYWLKIDRPANDLIDANLKIITVCHANPALFPRLKDDGTTVTFAASGQALLSAGPNSALVLDRFGFDTTTHAGVIDASLERGTLAVTSGQIVKQSPDAARFRTPNAILGVRGTAFVIDAGQGAP